MNFQEMPLPTLQRINENAYRQLNKNSEAKAVYERTKALLDERADWDVNLAVELLRKVASMGELITYTDLWTQVTTKRFPGTAIRNYMQGVQRECKSRSWPVLSSIVHANGDAEGLKAAEGHFEGAKAEGLDTGADTPLMYLRRQRHACWEWAKDGND